MMNTLQYLVLYLMEQDMELARALANHIKEFSRWILEQDLVRPPKEGNRLLQEFARQQQDFSRP